MTLANRYETAVARGKKKLRIWTSPPSIRSRLTVSGVREKSEQTEQVSFSDNKHIRVEPASILRRPS